MRRLAALVLVLVLLFAVGVPAAMAAEDTVLAALPSWIQWAMAAGAVLVAAIAGGWKALGRLPPPLSTTPAAVPAPHAPHPLHLEHVRRDDRIMTQADLDAMREDFERYVDARLELHEQHVTRAEIAATRALTAAAQVQASSAQVLAALKIAAPPATPGDHQ